MLNTEKKQEIIDSFKLNKALNKETIGILEEVLNLSDFVKFAKHKPLENEHEKCYADTYKFVDLTKTEVVKMEEQKVEENPT